MRKKTRTLILVIWFLVVGIAFWTHHLRPDPFENRAEILFGSSLVLACAAYLLFGMLRGITLIPIISLIAPGLLFIPPVPLYILTMTGIMVSSTTIYFFSDYLRLDSYFEKKYPAQISKLRSELRKNELWIVIGWSFFPFTPTDIICYVCGALRLDFWKFFAGVLLGEGSMCTLYIFFGGRIYAFFHQ